MATFEARKVLMKDAQGRYVIPFTGAVETVNGQKPDENGNVVIEGVDTTTLLTKTAAAETYLSKTDASTTYLNVDTAAGTFLSKTDAASTYLTPAQANAAYLGIGDKAVSAETADNAVSATMASKAISDANGNAIATTYLPLSGGTLTGTVVTTQNTSLARDGTGSYLGLFGAGTDRWNKGAWIQLFGVDHASNGGFQIGAVSTNSDGSTSTYALIGRGDGSLTWGNKRVTLTGDCLPLGGGTMTGSISVNHTGDAIRCTSDDQRIKLQAGTSYKNSSWIELRGKDYPDDAGVIALQARDASNISTLLARPSGELKWRGNNIVRFVNGVGADVTGNVKATPVGTVIAFAANSAPTGYLLCNGAAVSRTTYVELFAAIGTTYGAGDGSTTFNLPNLTDRFIQGSGTAGTVKSAGLPNVEGSLCSCPDAAYTTGNQTGAFYDAGKGSAVFPGEGRVNRSRMTLFDASRSSSIYGASTTVQPPALTMRYYIKF